LEAGWAKGRGWFGKGWADELSGTTRVGLGSGG
jgi:hypothetical protein